MKIAVYINELNGVVFHRLLLPYSKMKEWGYDVDFFTPNTFDINNVKTYDLFVYSRIMDMNILKALKGSVKLICDVDDYWELDKTHLLYDTYRLGLANKLKECIRIADYVTTTTQRLEKKIYRNKLNKNIICFDNALNSEGEFRTINNPSNKIRFGIIGSSSHTTDMELLKDIASYFSEDELDKIQFVLCGFDKSSITNIYRDGTMEVIDTTKTSNNPWVKWEKYLTNDYSIITDEHKNFLKEYDLTKNYETDEPYRRILAQDVSSYAYLYDEIDVLIAPLKDTEFNHYKSELKMIEAGIKHKGLIISDVEPYHKWIEDGVNCLAVNNKLGVEGFVNAIKKLMNEPECIDKIAYNLNKMVVENFNLDKITKDRIKWLESL